MAISTKNVILEYSLASGSGYTALAGIHEFSTPKIQIEKIDVTDLSSTDFTYIQGLIKKDDVSFKVFHTAAVYTILNTTLYNTPYYYRILFSDGAGVQFQAYLSELEAKGSPNSSIMWEAKLTLLGSVTFISGS